MIVNPPKQLNLVQLQQELATAGVHVAALGSLGNPPSEVHTYNPNGIPQDLPAAAAAVIAAHVAQPPAAVVQRATDAATLLNDPAVRDTQAHRDAFARLIGVQPVTIPLTQDATAADIALLS